MAKLHLISAMYASKGHGFEYVRNFCNQLGSDFEIVLHIASKRPLKTPNNINTHYTGIDYDKTDAKKFIKFSIFAPYARAIVKQKVSYVYYKKIIESNLVQNGDLVYIMDYDVIPLTYLISSLNKKGISDIFLWIHSAKFKSKDVLYAFYKRIFKLIFEKRIKNNIKGIVVNGEYIKNEILLNLNILPEKVHIIQYPSEIPFKKIPKALAREKMGFDIAEKVVLFFGMLRKDKNIEFTIKSVSNAKSSPKLIIAGSEASVTKSEISEWLLKHDLKKYHLDINYISEEKMATYYSCSDLLVLTYELESGSQSGPLSLAREFELPALVSNTGEIGKYVVDNNVGFAADTEKQDAFSEKIDLFFDKHNEQEKNLKENLKKAKEKFSWKSARQKYLNLFNV